MDSAYLAYVANDWKRAQEALKSAGAILSYRVISAEAHGTTDWKLMLMTEYKDLATYEASDRTADDVAQRMFGGDEKIRQGTKIVSRSVKCLVNAWRVKSSWNPRRRQLRNNWRLLISEPRQNSSAQHAEHASPLRFRGDGRATRSALSCASKDPRASQSPQRQPRNSSPICVARSICVSCHNLLYPCYLRALSGEPVLEVSLTG
jgi:hypothetical protein